jgi:hypothetical protein
VEVHLGPDADAKAEEEYDRPDNEDEQTLRGFVRAKLHEEINRCHEKASLSVKSIGELLYKGAIG